MTNPSQEVDRLEILMSTMNRDSLDFLKDIFPSKSFENLSVLIINQTTEQAILKSDRSSVRVINSFESGLPASRNLLLENAGGTYCLFADDDIRYEEGFEHTILEAFVGTPEADIITFMMTGVDGKLHREYPEIKWHNKKTVSFPSSVVIAFRKASVLKASLRFDPHFGLGTEFGIADEYIFLRQALNAGLKIAFEPKVILSHPQPSSGMRHGSDEIIYARAALFYKYSGFLGYLRLGKYLYQVMKKGMINRDEFWKKYNTGLKGIARYRELLREGSENT